MYIYVIIKIYYLLKELVSTIDFRYITDVITPDEAISMLHKAKDGRSERIDCLLKTGYPSYTTQVGTIFYYYICYIF